MDTETAGSRIREGNPSLKAFECRFGGAGAGTPGAPDGCSLTVYENGDVIRGEYVSGQEAPAGEMTLANRPALAERIREIIERYRGDLETVPDVLGRPWESTFRDWYRFGDLKILAWGLVRTGLADLNWESAVGDLERIRQESTVLDLYDEIAREINDSKVGVILEGRSVRLDSRLERLIRQEIVRKPGTYAPGGRNPGQAREPQQEEGRITARSGSIRGYKPEGK